MIRPPRVSLAIAVVMPWSLIHTECAAEEPAAAKPTGDRILLLDRRTIESVKNAELQIATPLKESRNPLLVPDQPWENATNNFYPNVEWDPEKRLWKLWYKDVLADKDIIDRMDHPDTVHGVGWYLLYAESSDGIVWNRPKLQLHAFDGKHGNNIVYRDCPNAGVFRDARDPDPERRYKMVFDVGLGKPRVSFSADGIQWTQRQEVRGFLPNQGDTHNNAFFDSRLGKFLWFTKMYMGERLVSRLESDDFLSWRSSGVVLRSAPEEGRASQTYALTVFPYANGYLGYLMMYHVGSTRKVDCELAWSPDSIRWERISPGNAFIKNGPDGSYDSGCVYAQAGPCVIRDGRIQIYYGGSATVHSGWKRSASLCLASIPEDGFAAYMVQSNEAPGHVHTTPLRLRSASPKAVFEGDVQMDIEQLAQDTVRLHFTLKPGARLYSVHGVELVNTSTKPPPGTESSRATHPKPPVEVNFQSGANGWTGVDSVEHLSEQGCIRIRRSEGLRPFLHGMLMPGNWQRVLGGTGLHISARVRSPIPHTHIRLEVFARDIAQWGIALRETVDANWTDVHAPIQYSWTDAEAEAAGWNRAPNAFSWQQTIQHAGKITISVDHSSASQTLDIQSIRLSPR